MGKQAKPLDQNSKCNGNEPLDQSEKRKRKEIEFFGQRSKGNKNCKEGETVERITEVKVGQGHKV